MSFTWGTTSTPNFQPEYPYASKLQLNASKTSGGDNTVIIMEVTDVGWEGDTPTNQDLADFLGAISTALQGEGWDVTVSESATVSRQLEETP